MKIIGGEIVEHEGINLQHQCIFCDDIIYDENPDEKGWYQNWLGGWECVECVEKEYYKCECGNVINIKYDLCTDCEMNKEKLK